LGSIRALEEMWDIVAQNHQRIFQFTKVIFSLWAPSRSLTTSEYPIQDAQCNLYLSNFGSTLDSYKNLTNSAYYLSDVQCKSVFPFHLSHLDLLEIPGKISQNVSIHLKMSYAEVFLHVSNTSYFGLKHSQKAIKLNLYKKKSATR